MNTKTEGLKPVTPEKLTDSQTMLAEHISRAVAPYLMPLVERGLVLAAIRDALPRRTPIESNTEPVAFKTFTYTRTFNAIAAAVEWKPNHAFGISVAKFIEAFGTVDAPVSVAPAVTDEQKVRAQPLRGAELRSEEC